jgi:hypothetical protein
MKKVLFSFFGALLLLGGANAQQMPVLDLFYGAECPHCHEEIEWLKKVQLSHTELKVNKYEVWHNNANQLLMQQRLLELGEKPIGVPLNIIGKTVIIGFQRQEILNALKDTYALDCDYSCTSEEAADLIEDTPGWEKWLKASWPIMALALGLADGFNPCAMWSLFVLLGFLLNLDSKKRRWLIGGIFISSSGILYFSALLAYLFGFGEISALMATSTMDWVFRGVGLLALGTGTHTLWIARKAQIECSVRDASSRRKFYERMTSVLEKKSLWLVLLGVIGLAFSVNSVELLCSFAIPTTFTATLVSLKLPLWQQLTALGIYDIAYIFDDLLVFLIAMWTLSLKVFSPKIVQWSHVIGGILLLIIGGVLLFDPALLNQILG